MESMRITFVLEGKGKGIFSYTYYTAFNGGALRSKVWDECDKKRMGLGVINVQEKVGQ
jgi:hypothetical protein